MPDVDLNVIIIGGGVVGLTTALKFQNVFGNNINCTLIAEHFNEHTTSYGAAGIFRPSPSFIMSTAEVTKKCINNSYKYYNDLLYEGCGVKEISGYVFSKTDTAIVRNHFLEDIVPLYRRATEEELAAYPGNWKYGSYFNTLLIECKSYLPWAMTKFEENGGKIVRKKVNTLSDLEKFGKVDLLLNCSGLGSKRLFNDQKMVPIRGQVFKVLAPWLDKFYFGEYDTYIIPGLEGIATLGGIRQYDSWRTEVCKHDAAAIWERCIDILPELVDNSRIINQWVGLRPHRDSGVRVEAEILNGLKIVHNYGHGGYGVTSAPGTADQAVQLALHLMRSSNMSKL